MNPEQRRVCNINKCMDPGCYNNLGASTRSLYDACQTQKKVLESTSSLQFALYEGKYESCSKCLLNHFWRPFDTEMVDVESELKNITRPASRCPQFRYNPNCKKSDSCISTRDPSVPVVFPPEVCPILKNNIPRFTHPGYTVPNTSIPALCGKSKF